MHIYVHVIVGLSQSMDIYIASLKQFYFACNVTQLLVYTAPLKPISSSLHYFLNRAHCRFTAVVPDLKLTTFLLGDRGYAHVSYLPCMHIVSSKIHMHTSPTPSLLVCTRVSLGLEASYGA